MRAAGRCHAASAPAEHHPVPTRDKRRERKTHEEARLDSLYADRARGRAEPDRLRRRRCHATGSVGRQERRRDLRGKPQLRQPVRQLPGRERPAERDGRELGAEGPRRLDARDAAEGLGRPDRDRHHAGGHRGDDGEPAEHAVRDRRSEGLQSADEHRDARHRAPLLSGPDADRRRQERHVRRLDRCRRPDDGPLHARSVEAAAVEARAAVRAGRQLLHGRVRRFVPEPPVPGLRVRTVLPERRQERRGRQDRGAERRRQVAAGRVELAGLRAERPAEVRQRRRAHARLLRREHDAAGLPAERQQGCHRRRSAARRPGEPVDDAAADGHQHRRPDDRRGRVVGMVFGRVGPGAAGEPERYVERDLRRRSVDAELPAAPSAVQLLREPGAGHREPCAAPARRRRERRGLHQGDRRGHAAAGDVLQAARQPERAPGLHGRHVRRPAHRRRDRAPAGQPAVEEHGRDRHVRRERRFLGSRRTAERRPLGPGHAHSGADRVAVREEGLRRPYAVRHRLDPALHHAPLLAAAPRGPATARRRAGRTAHSRWAT